MSNSHHSHHSHYDSLNSSSKRSSLNSSKGSTSIRSTRSTGKNKLQSSQPSTKKKSSKFESVDLDDIDLDSTAGSVLVKPESAYQINTWQKAHELLGDSHNYNHGSPSKRHHDTGQTPKNNTMTSWKYTQHSSKRMPTLDISDDDDISEFPIHHVTNSIFDVNENDQHETPKVSKLEKYFVDSTTIQKDSSRTITNFGDSWNSDQMKNQSVASQSNASSLKSGLDNNSNADEHDLNDEEKHTSFVRKKQGRPESKRRKAPPPLPPQAAENQPQIEEKKEGALPRVRSRPPPPPRNASVAAQVQSQQQQKPAEDKGGELNRTRSRPPPPPRNASVAAQAQSQQQQPSDESKELNRTRSRPPPPPRNASVAVPKPPPEPKKSGQSLLRGPKSFFQSFHGSFSIPSPNRSKNNLNSNENDSSAATSKSQLELTSLGKKYPNANEQLARMASAISFGFNKMDSVATGVEEIELDCGHTLDKPILSYKHALQMRAYNHAGEISEDGTSFDEHPLCSNFGWHDYPLRWLFSKDPPDIGILERYGIGIMLWFKFLKAFCLVFLVMFLISLPSIMIYWNGEYIPKTERNYVLHTSPTDLVSTTTFGNLGSHSILCFKANKGESVTLACESGYIDQITAYYGKPSGHCYCPSTQLPLASGECPGKIVDSTSTQGCSKNRWGKEQACYPGDLRFDYMTEAHSCCSTKSDVDEKTMADFSDLEIKVNKPCNSRTAQYIAEGMCVGKQSCTLTSDPNYQYTIYGGADTIPYGICYPRDLSATIECNTTLSYAGVWDECFENGEEDRYLNILAYCKQDFLSMNTEQTVLKTEAVTLVGALNAFAILVFVFAITWVLNEQIKETEYMERNTCRAQDYTVKTDSLPPSKNTHELAKKLKKHFEKILSEAKPCFLPGNVKIADINFTTGSYKMLQAQINRGAIARKLDVIMYKKRLGEDYNHLRWLFDSQAYLEKEYEKWQKICDAKSETADSRVLRAYITFESEEGYHRCIRTFPSNAISTIFSGEEISIEGTTMRVDPAEDPSDILWENLGTPYSQKLLRRTFTMILLLCLLGGTYFVVDEAINSSHQFENKYPFMINCKDYTVDITPGLMNQTSSSEITYGAVLRDSMYDYYNNTDGGLGFLQCFCGEVYKEEGLQSALGYKFFNAESEEYEPWCLEVAEAYILLSIVRLGVALVVVSVNVSSKSILRAFREFERRESITEIDKSLTFKLFLVQIVNTGLLVLLMNGYVKNLNPDQNVNFLNGAYSDFTSEWYADVGKGLIGTMVLYIFGVHTLKTLMLFYQKFLRWYDRYFTSNRHLTRQVIQDQLDKLYIGPQFIMEVRYATVMTIAFICVSYAPAMPLMYLVASLGFFIMYWVDKHFFLRVNQLPQSISPRLAINITKSFYIPAAINLAIAIWAFSNVLLFAPTVTVNTEKFNYNSIAFVDTRFAVNRVDGLYERIFNRYTAASWLLLLPCFLIIFFLFLVYILKKFRVPFVLKWFTAQKEYEGNPEYFDAIPLYLLKRRVEEGIAKKHIYHKYKKRLHALEKEGEQEEPKQLEGLESYDIGLNYIYAEKIAFNSDYILQKRPKDLFHENNSLICDSVDDDDKPRPKSAILSKQMSNSFHRQASNVVPYSKQMSSVGQMNRMSSSFGTPAPFLRQPSAAWNDRRHNGLIRNPYNPMNKQLVRNPHGSFGTNPLLAAPRPKLQRFNSKNLGVDKAEEPVSPKAQSQGLNKNRKKSFASFFYMKDDMQSDVDLYNSSNSRSNESAANGFGASRRDVLATLADDDTSEEEVEEIKDLTDLF